MSTKKKTLKKWTNEEVRLVRECLRYAQRECLLRHDFTNKKINELCERINFGDTYTEG